MCSAKLLLKSSPNQMGLKDGIRLPMILFKLYLRTLVIGFVCQTNFVPLRVYDSDSAKESCVVRRKKKHPSLLSTELGYNRLWIVCSRNGRYCVPKIFIVLRQQPISFKEVTTDRDYCSWVSPACDGCDEWFHQDSKSSLLWFCHLPLPTLLL